MQDPCERGAGGKGWKEEEEEEEEEQRRTCLLSCDAITNIDTSLSLRTLIPAPMLETLPCSVKAGKTNRQINSDEFDTYSTGYYLYRSASSL